MAEILLIDDDRRLRETIREVLQSAGHNIREASNGHEALAELEVAPADAALCDWRMPVMGGHQFLQELRERNKAATMPVLVLTAFGDGESAMEAMQAGAYDFLVKPIDLDLILAKLQAALRHSALQRDLAELDQTRFTNTRRFSEPAKETQQLIGRSPLWIDVFKRIGQVAQTHVSVLVRGETGTGKELVARTIHQRSNRSRGPMITVNCAAIPAELVESELFGHEKGAFTGASMQRIGRFEAAEGGTIFLDEIGELPLSVQPKLLRVLQERTLERVGSNRTISVDARVIAATNRDLRKEVEAKQFRADLFYRLNAYELELPPLRQRTEDIVLLAEYFLSRFAARNGIEQSILPAETAAELRAYDFPGNVRELEQLMDRLAVGAPGRPITVDRLREVLRGKNPLSEISNIEVWEDLPFHESVARWEQHLIERAIRLSDGNKSDAARRLGIQRRLLYEKLEQFASANNSQE